MKRAFLCLTFALLMGCTTTQTPQKWAITERTIHYNAQGEVMASSIKVVPVKPFNFWSTLWDVGVGVAKKQGGL